jgi:SAM-dependent methyltransferase
VTFQETSRYWFRGNVDLVYCNGVFHHIPVAERKAAMRFIWRSLKPGGYFAFWENNPWNPGTRYIMNRVPFDRDAVMLSANQARELLRSAGFHVERTDYLFVFPRVLRKLRWIESHVSSLPFGAQYLVLSRKSDNESKKDTE